MVLIHWIVVSKSVYIWMHVIILVIKYFTKQQVPYLKQLRFNVTVLLKLKVINMLVIISMDMENNWDLLSYPITILYGTSHK